MTHQAFAQKMQSYTLLYVEDDTQVREHMTEFLNRYCKKVYACDSSERGMQIYEQKSPDILLLDINLPGMSGIDMATEIRKNDKNTRILISTAYTNKEFMLRAIELELTRYLVKPVTSEELFLAFEKCLEELQTDGNILLGDGYVYDKRLAAIVKGDVKNILRKKEAALLEFFIAHEGEVIRYEILEDTIWGDGVMTRDAIRSQMRNLRKKIGLNLFENISGVGYRFQRGALS